MKIDGDRVKVVWCKSREVIDSWRKHLSEIGIPPSILDELTDGVNFAATEGKFKERLVALTIIWYEYRKSWDEFADWIQEGFQLSDEGLLTGKFVWAAGVDFSDTAGRFRYIFGRWQFLDDSGNWINVHLGSAPRYAQSGDGQYWIYQSIEGTGRGGMNIFPNHNNLFQFYVDKIINEFCRLILNKPESGSINDIMEYIFQNWNF